MAMLVITRGYILHHISSTKSSDFGFRAAQNPIISDTSRLASQLGLDSWSPFSKYFPIFQPLILYLDYLVSNELGQYLQSFIVILTPNLCFPHFVQIKVSASKIPVSITPQSARHAQPTWSGRRAADPGVYGPWQLRGKDRNPPAKERNLVESGIKNHQKLPCPVKANLAMNNHRNIIIFDRTIFTSRAVLQWKSGLWTKYLVKLDFLSLNSPSPLSVKSFTTHLKLVPLRQPHGPISTQLPLGPRGRHLPGLRCARAPGTVVSKIDCSLPASLQSFLLFSFPLFLALLLPVLLGLLLPLLLAILTTLLSKPSFHNTFENWSFWAWIMRFGFCCPNIPSKWGFRGRRHRGRRAAGNAENPEFNSE